jgi:hypothetical protein
MIGIAFEIACGVGAILIAFAAVVIVSGGS